MTSPTTGAPGATDLPDYAPVPWSALGPALNDQGHYVGRVERNLYRGHRRHLPVGVHDHPGRRRAVRRAPDHRP